MKQRPWKRALSLMLAFALVFAIAVRDGRVCGGGTSGLYRAVVG